MENFDKIFEDIKPIILKFKRGYFIHLWEHDDWLQEGRIVLYQLLCLKPELIHNKSKLYIYFKTKFSSHIKDSLRYQESQKRKFNKMPYDEIGEVAHKLPSEGLLLDEQIVYEDIIKELKVQLNKEESQNLEKLLSGQRFAGRKNFLKKLKPFFVDF